MSATPKYSLIGAGQGRNASVWLTTVLTDNSVCPNAKIAHESFRVAPWVTFMAWQRITSPVVIETNVSLEILLPLIETFGAQVGVVLREPVAWIQSLMARMLRKRRAGARSGLDVNRWLDTIRHTAIATFCRTETMLAIMEQAGLPPTCWHMDHCITEAGVREIAAWAGLSLRKELQLPGRINSTKKHERLSILAECPTTKKEIDAVIRQFRRVRAAYASVGVSIG